MRRGSHNALLEAVCGAYAVMTMAYPRSFRRRFAREMRLAFRCEALAAQREKRLTELMARVLGDWIITLCKEYFEMPRIVFGAAVALVLLLVDWLTFHDLFEPHTGRDYLTFAASLLVFIYIGFDLFRANRDGARKAL